MKFYIEKYETMTRETTERKKNCKIRNALERSGKRKLQVLRNIGSGHHQVNRDEIKKLVVQKYERTARDQFLLQKRHQIN